MKNQSFYAIVVTLLVLITVAVWQFFSLASSERMREPYAASDPENRSFNRPTPAATPK